MRLDLVELVAAATASVVLLAARAGLDTHAETIEVLHMLGSTDVQVARLFALRIATDTLMGGAIGTLAALAFLAFLGTRLGALGAEIVAGIGLRAGDWAVLAVLPLLFALMAALAVVLYVLVALLWVRDTLGRKGCAAARGELSQAGDFGRQRVAAAPHG
ncbi:hypothetical protein FKK16_26755, partial [Klebsiella pneumoniae]|nr:hypothetical protein [Klebsiella pneumoniae]